MGNVFYVPEYAQQLEREQLRVKLEQLLEASPDVALDQLDDDTLVQIVIALEGNLKALREKLNAIQSQQHKIQCQFKQLYASPTVRDRIIKSRPIEDLEGFPFRVYTLLRRADIVTVYDLCNKSREELSIIFRRNKRFLSFVEDYLSDIGLSLYGVGDAGDADTTGASESDIQATLKRKVVDF